MADTAQDPLRTLMSMADDLRTNVESMVNQGTKSMQAALPSLPGFPGQGKTAKGGPGDILSRLPKIPSLPPLPGTTTEKKTTTGTGTVGRPAPTSNSSPGYRLRNTFTAQGYQLRA